jgi:predicted ATPase
MLDDGHRLVTLTGPGGIGKSRLAIAAARAVETSFPDGVVFVDLAPVIDPDLVITTVANTLGIRDTGEAPIAETLRLALAGRRMLLVIDNVEQVVDAAPALAALLGATEVSVLATSRILLRVTGEESIELGPLPPEAAVDLLVERARAVKPDFELTEANAAQVVAICTALDCAPLALELAAARLRVLTPAALEERLDHALPLLTGGARDLPERQRTLRATIDWSAQLLRQGERELLLRLGVFRSGFGLDAAEWMTDGLGDVDAMDALAALIDGSLVREQDRGERAWYTMLATVREYGREHLEERGILTEAEERHARFYVMLADASGRESSWMDQIALMSRLADERDELRAAVDHFLATGRFHELTDLVWHLHWFWWVGGQLGEVHGWMSRMLASGADLDERSRTIARFYSSSIRFGEATDADGVAVLADCVEYFHREHDVYGETLSLVMLAVSQLSLDPPELDSAEANLARGLELAEQLGNTFGRTLVRIMLARAAMSRGRLDRAFELLREGLEIARAGGDRLGEAIALNHLGWERLLSGDVDGAREAFVEQLDISSTFGHEEGFAYGLEAMSAVAAVTGDLERSGTLFGAAENVRARKGLSTGGSFSLHGRILERALAASGADGTDAFEHGRRAGRSADLADMVALALASQGVATEPA